MHVSRIPPAEKYTWTSPKGNGKNKTVSATYLEKRVKFQVPPCRCRMYTNEGSQSLYLTLENDIHDKFREVVEEYESYVASLVDPEGVLEISSSIKTSGQYTSFRLTVWETQWFDEHASYLRDPPESMTACSCILEFQGAWVGTSSYGLKFKPLQIKKEPTKIVRVPQPVFALLDDD